MCAFLGLFERVYTIEELKTLDLSDNRKKLRQSCIIAIIDDEGFSEAKKNGLERRGFVIHTFTDIERPNLLAEYPIIISDINGVAKALDEDEQGIALIRQIVKQYPNKGVAIYSGVPRQIPDLPSPVLVINKDDDLDTWEDKIDELIDYVSDPTIIWKRIAKQLIEKGLPTTYLPKIESDYVGRVINKESFENFPKIQSSLDANMRNIITGVTSNGIFWGLTKLIGI